MDKLFLAVLNMSLTGAFVIAAICVVRLPLKKAPKIISYCLWLVAGFRLVFPYAIESVFSLIPFKAQPIPQDIGMQAVPRIDSGIKIVNSVISNSLPAATPQASANPLQIWIGVGAFIWFVGMAAMLMYGVVSLVILKWKMRRAAHVEANMYEAANIKSPFAFGVLKPRIYLPVGLGEREKSYILLHEQTHIRRCDHIVKFAAYCVLCVHWFNPLVWLAFRLMGMDMEMSCDERVLQEIGGETKKDYSLSLLSLATERHMMGGSPLAFGAGHIKGRIKNVLNFKKPSQVIVVVAVALVVVLSTGFAMNRIANAPLIAMRMIYEENPAYPLRDMKLVWDDAVYHVTSMANPERGREIGYATDENSTWQIYELKGYGRDYLLAVESEDVWRVMSIHSPEAPWRQYILEDATEKERMERMLSVSLYNDGTARLATPLISSYALQSPCYYTFADGELLIHYERDDVIARFEMVDDDTLVFKEATVPLFADGGARYVSVSVLDVPMTAYKPRAWMETYHYRPIMFDVTFDEFPGVIFDVTEHDATATDKNGVKSLVSGSIRNIYLADLNGDGLPEFCATVRWGSGLIDSRIVVYDYANGERFEISDRMRYDYFLSLEDGQLIVTQGRLGEETYQSRGSMAIIDGELVLFGIDRTVPDVESVDDVDVVDDAGSVDEIDNADDLYMKKEG